MIAVGATTKCAAPRLVVIGEAGLDEAGHSRRLGRLDKRTPA